MVPDIAPRPSLTVQAASAEEDVFTERWRQWQLKNAATSRMDARRARVAFTIIFAVLGGWLGLQLLTALL